MKPKSDIPLTQSAVTAVELNKVRAVVALLSVALERASWELAMSDSEEAQTRARLIREASEKVQAMDLAQFDQQVDGAISDVQAIARKEPIIY